MRVRISPAAQLPPNDIADFRNLAYVIGVALGDGNLSNPNGRATRLRVTCDLKYPQLIDKMKSSMQGLLPNNKVFTVPMAENCLYISCYSNKGEGWLGWKARAGSKFKQQVRVPQWIKDNENYAVACLQGLFETDGCFYSDRGYPMTMFTSVIQPLAEDVYDMITQLEFTAHVYKIKQSRPILDRYNVRVSKNTECFIQRINFKKE